MRASCSDKQTAFDLIKFEITQTTTTPFFFDGVALPIFGRYHLIMSFPLKCFFFILVITCGFVHIRGSDLKPSKGETCSFGGPGVDGDGEQEPCYKDGLYSAISDVRLPRRDPVAVDHVQTIQVDEEKTLQLKTRSVKPPVFEIPGLLSDDECDHLVNLANTNGLAESATARRETVTREGVNTTLTQRQMGIYCKRICRFDKNEDGNITVREFNDYVYSVKKMLVTRNDVWNAYEALLLEGASYITYENCTKVNRTQFVEFMYRLHTMYRFPYYNERYSMHTWVEFSKKDPVLERIKRRVAEVTQISALQIEHSEDLQVKKKTESDYLVLASNFDLVLDHIRWERNHFCLPMKLDSLHPLSCFCHAAQVARLHPAGGPLTKGKRIDYKWSLLFGEDRSASPSPKKQTNKRTNKTKQKQRKRKNKEKPLMLAQPRGTLEVKGSRYISYFFKVTRRTSPKNDCS